MQPSSEGRVQATRERSLREARFDGMTRAAKTRKTRAKGAAAAKRPSRKSRGASKRWSGHVTKHSDALDLKEGVFTWSDPKRIAASLKRSAQASRRRKADPYRSALSMLVFYINRAGRKLPAKRKRVLQRAKTELRNAFGRE